MTHDEMIAVIQAHKDGKVIEFKAHGVGSWSHCQSPLWDFNRNDYRVKPTPKRVPLGPDDFPPGTVVTNYTFGGWRLVVEARDEEIVTTSSNWSYASLTGQCSDIRRRLPGSSEWLPCWREE